MPSAAHETYRVQPLKLAGGDLANLLNCHDQVLVFNGESDDWATICFCDDATEGPLSISLEADTEKSSP